MNYKLFLPVLLFFNSLIFTVSPQRPIKKYHAKISAVEEGENPVIQQIWPQQQIQQIPQSQQSQYTQQYTQESTLNLENLKKELDVANQKISELEMKLSATEQARSKAEKELLYYKGFYEGFSKMEERKIKKELSPVLVPVTISSASAIGLLIYLAYLCKKKK